MTNEHLSGAEVPIRLPARPRARAQGREAGHHVDRRSGVRPRRRGAQSGRDARPRKTVRDGHAPGHHQRACPEHGIPKGRLPAIAGRLHASRAKGEATMAEIVTAYCASHAPMQAVDPESAPKHQADSFFAGLEYVRNQAERARPQAVVMLSGEHFTNYFLDALPQLGIGLAEKYNTPSARWLRM